MILKVIYFFICFTNIQTDEFYSPLLEDHPSCKPKLQNSYGINYFENPQILNMKMCPFVETSCCPEFEQLKMFRIYNDKILTQQNEIFEYISSLWKKTLEKSLKAKKTVQGIYEALNVSNISNCQILANQIMSFDLEKVNEKFLTLLNTLYDQYKLSQKGFLCTLCDGDIQKFFDLKSRKIIISSEQCNNIIFHGFQPLIYMHLYFKILFQQITNFLECCNVDGKYKCKDDYQPIIQFAIDNSIKTMFKQCKEEINGKRENCYQICENFNPVKIDQFFTGDLNVLKKYYLYTTQQLNKIESELAKKKQPKEQNKNENQDGKQNEAEKPTQQRILEEQKTETKPTTKEQPKEQKTEEKQTTEKKDEEKNKNQEEPVQEEKKIFTLKDVKKLNLLEEDFEDQSIIDLNVKYNTLIIPSVQNAEEPLENFSIQVSSNQRGINFVKNGKAVVFDQSIYDSLLNESVQLYQNMEKSSQKTAIEWEEIKPTPEEIQAAYQLHLKNQEGSKQIDNGNTTEEQKTNPVPAEGQQKQTTEEQKITPTEEKKTEQNTENSTKKVEEVTVQPSSFWSNFNFQQIILYQFFKQNIQTLKILFLQKFYNQNQHYYQGYIMTNKTKKYLLQHQTYQNFQLIHLFHFLKYFQNFLIKSSLNIQFFNVILKNLNNINTNDNIQKVFFNQVFFNNQLLILINKVYHNLIFILKQY